MEKSIAKYEYKNLKCLGCGIVFDSKTRNKKQRFCTKKCSANNNENKGRKKKGCIAWNKGLIGYRLGHEVSNDTRMKIGLANSQEKSAMWKGKDVGYYALHDWVRKYKGKPKLCSNCGKTKGRIEWANKSHKYKRDLDDWISFCVPCHKKYDKAVKL